MFESRRFPHHRNSKVSRGKSEGSSDNALPVPRSTSFGSLVSYLGHNEAMFATEGQPLNPSKYVRQYLYEIHRNGIRLIPTQVREMKYNSAN
jgi:hypothetical protein